jgi:hypothetical protein
MKTIYAKHEPYTDGHYDEVMREMEVQGQPTIRCVERNGQLYALEGSHRLAVALAAIYSRDGAPGRLGTKAQATRTLPKSRSAVSPVSSGVEPKIVVLTQDADEGLDAFWDRVAPNLPRYDFDRVHVLDMRKFGDVS